VSGETRPGEIDITAGDILVEPIDLGGGEAPDEPALAE
jgi:hypothetical protein